MARERLVQCDAGLLSGRQNHDHPCSFFRQFDDHRDRRLIRSYLPIRFLTFRSGGFRSRNRCVALQNCGVHSEIQTSGQYSKPWRGRPKRQPSPSIGVYRRDTLPGRSCVRFRRSPQPVRACEPPEPIHVSRFDCDKRCTYAQEHAGAEALSDCFCSVVMSPVQSYRLPETNHQVGVARSIPD